MSVFKTRLLIGLIAFGCIISGIIGGCLYYFYPVMNWDWYLVIAFFFLIVELLSVSYVENQSRSENKKKLVNTYMLVKVVKVILSLILLTVYVVSVGQDIKAFVIIFMTFYLLYLMMETYVFIKIEKQIKNKAQ